MSADPATSPVLGRLRRIRGHHEAAVRWLNLLAPVLLVMFLVAAFTARPAPGLTGRPLIVTVAVLAFFLAVLGRNVTAARHRRARAGFVAVALASSVALMWLQPDGPGAEAMLLGALFVARLLPRPAIGPFVVVAFVTVEAVAWVSGRGGLAVLTALAGFYGLALLAFRLNEANKEAEHLLVELHRSQQAQARAAGLAERQRLAREMHDVLAHSLSGLLLQLEGARMLAVGNPGDPRLPEVIERAHHLGRAGLAEARQAIGTLRGDELPGPERLAGLATDFERDCGVPCRLTVSGTSHELGSDVRLALYRVAQEALTNVAKHARPERVELRLVYEPGATRLAVEDFAHRGAVSPAGPRDDLPDGDLPDGDPPGGNPPDDAVAGYGLAGMRERAELLGARLAATTTRGGFLVELVVPRCRPRPPAATTDR